MTLSFRPENVFACTAVAVSLGALFAGCALARPDSPAPHWIKMPILTAEQKAKGIFPGGEGCQWPRDLQISEADPQFLLLCIDVGGMYRTLDGGVNWEQATVGWNARGCNCVAIDPKNAKHVIGVAGNSMDWDSNWGPSANGIYLSNDQAASWKPILGLTEGYGESAAFDPSSFDAAKGICTVAYVSSPKSGLLRTADGGETWTNVSPLPTTIGMAAGGSPAKVRVAPRGGVVYLGGNTGFYRSTDGGKTFAKTAGGAVAGVSVVSSRPESVWISGADGLQTSADSGKTWTKCAAAGVDRESDNKQLLNVIVSRAEPRNMTLWVEGANWHWVRYVSHDGGASFSPMTVVKSGDPMPLNVRNGFTAWHPTKPDVLYGLGGDIVTRSTDGGKTLTWYNNGYNGVMLGGMMNFSPRNPNVVFLSFQDYNAAATQDGGATWAYYDASGKGWGGHCYGGYAASPTLFYYGDADSWGTPRRIRLTRDAGKTWEFVRGADGKEITLNGANVSLSDPADPNILFCYDHRSPDGGKTWAAMTGCDGVFIASPSTKTLYGRQKTALLRSTDHGATWEKIADQPDEIGDVAVDHKTGRVYIAAGDKLKAWQNGAWTEIALPADQFGAPLRCQTVATDPQAPNVVYAGGPRNIYASHCTIARSTDGGKTWRNLTVTTPLRPGIDNGPHEVSCIRVHPVTREAWVAGQCYGMWRIAAPAPGETGVSAALASAPKAFRPPLAPTFGEAVVAGK